MPALTAAWEYAKEDVTTRLPGWQSADHLGNGIYYEKRWVPSIEAATGGVVEVGVRGLPTTRFNWLLIQHFISDTDATRVYAGGSDHPIYTLRDLSVCVDPRSTGATGIPVRLVVLTTTVVKTGVAGPWGQADAQKKNYDVEFELNRLILVRRPTRRCRFAPFAPPSELPNLADLLEKNCGLRFHGEGIDLSLLSLRGDKGVVNDVGHAASASSKGAPPATPFARMVWA